MPKEESHKEIIEIYEGDEITSVIDKLLNSKSSRVVFTVSKNSKIFRNLINLKLLKREAENIGKEIGIFAFDENDRRLAKKAGIKVYDEIYDENIPEKIDDEDFFSELFETKEESEREIIESELNDPNNDSFDGMRRMADIVNPRIRATKEAVKEKKYIQEVEKPKLKKDELILPLEEEKSGKKINQILVEEKNFFKKNDNEKFGEKPVIVDKKEGSRVESTAKKSFSDILFNFLSSKIFALILVFSFIIAGLTLYLILPQAKITITPKIDKGNFSFAIIADKSIFDIDYANFRIPAQSVELEKIMESEFLATEKKVIEEKASGKITVYNAYSSLSQTLVAQTRFESSNGKIFRIAKSLIVPGAKIENGKIIPSEVDVEVIAEKAGSDYNIEQSNFTIPGFKGSPKFDGFYAKNKLPIIGGFKGEAVVITDDDLRKAKEEFESGLIEKLKFDFANKIPLSLKLIDGAMAINIEYVELPKVNDRSEKFLIKAKGKASTILFNEKDLDNFINENIMKQLPKNRLQIISTRQYDYSSVNLNFKDGKLSFSLKVTEDVAAKIDDDYIKINLTGKNENQIKDFFLNETDVENVKVVFWPFWVSEVPSNKNKIKILIN